MRAWIATRLRYAADRIDPHGAFRAMSSSSFTFELGEGIRFRHDRRGCPLWYYGRDDYDRALDEADTDWATMTLVDPAATWTRITHMGNDMPDPSTLPPDGSTVAFERHNGDMRTVGTGTVRHVMVDGALSAEIGISDVVPDGIPPAPIVDDPSDQIWWWPL